MTVRLHEAGLFTWPEWAETLGREIAKAGDDTVDGADPTDAYYRHWLDALETLLTEKQVIGEAERQDRIAAWDRAARAHAAWGADRTWRRNAARVQRLVRFSTLVKKALHPLPILRDARCARPQDEEHQILGPHPEKARRAISKGQMPFLTGCQPSFHSSLSA